MVTHHLIIRGKVKGVFYRDSARKEATRLQIRGWIRNNEDGTVEATITGEDDAVRQFINWCKQGPPKANVEEVIVTPTATKSFSTFSILR